MALLCLQALLMTFVCKPFSGLLFSCSTASAAASHQKQPCSQAPQTFQRFIHGARCQGLPCPLPCALLPGHAPPCGCTTRKHTRTCLQSPVMLCNLSHGTLPAAHRCDTMHRAGDTVRLLHLHALLSRLKTGKFRQTCLTADPLQHPAPTHTML